MKGLKKLFLKPQFQYLKEFTPKDWGKKRPFAFELYYKPAGAEFRPRDENVCEKLKRIKGVRLRRDGTYVVGPRNAQLIPRNFYWFALRSLRNNKYRNLWAFFNCILNSADNSISAEEMASLTDGDSSLCKNWLEKLANGHIVIRKANKYFIDEKSGEFLLLCEKLSSVAPKLVEEIVMDFLCSNYGSRKGEVCDYMSESFGLTGSTSYKAIKKLEKQNFVSVIAKHVGKKGPASDHVFVNCNNCFFLFASQEECLEHEIMNFDKNLEKFFARKLKNEERTALLKFIKARPEGPQLLRKLNLILYFFAQLKKDVAKKKHLQEAIHFLEKEINLTLTF